MAGLRSQDAGVKVGSARNRNVLPCRRLPETIPRGRTRPVVVREGGKLHPLDVTVEHVVGLV
jgi:hypothetical protein